MKEHTSQYEWDLHFMKEAKLWMNKSKCLSRKIGAILVKDNRVIATGYNGVPMGIPHCDYRDDYGYYLDEFVSDECPRKRMGFDSSMGMENCPAVHAEINPILQCARFGVSTIGTTLYAYCGTPCINCTKEIIQAGIKRVIVLGKSGSSYAPIKDGDNPKKVGYNFPLSEKLFSLSKVKLEVITEEEINEI